MSRTLLLAIITAAAVLGQQPPSAEELLASYTAALGGAEKLRALNAVTIKGTMDNPDDGSKIPVEIQAKAPNRYARTTRISDSAAYRTVFAGDAGWNQDPENGVRPMSKADVANGRLDYDLRRAVRLAELYPKLATPRRAKLGNRDAWALEAATEGGAAETWYFDPASKLLLCREYERVTLEEGILRIQEFYSDYKDFEGLKFPGTVRQVMPDYELLYHYDSVQVNPAVEDSVFARPQ